AAPDQFASKQHPAQRKPAETITSAGLKTSSRQRLASSSRMTKDFAERARLDVEEVLKTVHAARPKPKELLFSFGIGSGSAVIVENDERKPMQEALADSRNT
ncbi:hypothetical protein, partial [Methylocystis sp.]|uniref:hypothetical protein n=1 Tax=Methylocystis sp. TaxID=1911079 RepID=UPI003D0B2265